MPTTRQHATGSVGTNFSLGQQYYGFGASIPSGTLSGIEVRVDYWINQQLRHQRLLTVDLSTMATTGQPSRDADDSEPRSQPTVLFRGPRPNCGARTWTAADLSNLARPGATGEIRLFVQHPRL